MPRKANHQGSITERKNGLWQGQIRLLGKRVNVYGKSETEVREKLESLARQVTIYNAPPKQHKLFELLDGFIQHIEGSRQPRTVADYRAVINDIKQNIADVPLGKLHQGHLRLLYARFCAKPRRAVYVHQVLHHALKLACRWEWLDANPADNVEPPRYRPKEKVLWSQEDCRAFIAQSRDSDWWPIIVFTLYTGLRCEELSALRWTDVDYRHKVVRIDRTAQRINRVWVWGKPKTRTGKRNVHLEAMAFEALERQKQLQAQWSEKGPWQENGLIFTKRDGDILYESTPNEALKRLCRTYSLPVISMHCLRHLYASLALQEGAPVALVSRQLGHANVNITTTIYSHAITDGKAVSEALRRALQE